MDRKTTDSVKKNTKVKKICTVTILTFAVSTICINSYIIGIENVLMVDFPYSWS